MIAAKIRADILETQARLRELYRRQDEILTARAERFDQMIRRFDPGMVKRTTVPRSNIDAPDA